MAENKVLVAYHLFFIVYPVNSTKSATVFYLVCSFYHTGPSGCGKINPLGADFASAFTYALESVDNQGILNGVTLGGVIFDRYLRIVHIDLSRQTRAKNKISILCTKMHF